MDLSDVLTKRRHKFQVPALTLIDSSVKTLLSFFFNSRFLLIKRSKRNTMVKIKDDRKQ